MKKTTKVILSSALTMGLCASLIAGSTLAMFSSRSNVNVAITSGKVDVVASVDEDSLTAYSTVWNEGKMQYEEVAQPDDHFHAGGFYSYSAGALTFTNIAAGDAVEFKLNIENNSTLAIQYRVQLTVPTQQESGAPQGDLVKKMQVSFDGGDPVTIGNTSTIAQKWSDPVEVGTPITTQPTVKISVPAELEGNQSESCLLHVGVYAVQLGTHTANSYGTYNVYTASDFMKLVNGSKIRVSSFKGETIALMNDIDLDPNAEDVSTLSLALADAPMPIAAVQSELNWDSEFQGTLDGNGFTISNFKSVEAPAGMGADMPKGFINTTRDATIRNLIISDAAISFNSQNVGTSARDKYNQGGTLVGVAYGTLTVENVVIKNSTVKSTTNYTNKCTGAGGKNVKTKEEALQDNPTWNSYPLVGYDVIGALIGQVNGETTINNVKVTLNETSAELTGAEQIKDYKEEVLRQFKGNKLIGEINGNVTYIGDTTLDCISEDGIDESMTFNAETATSGVPTPSVEIGSANSLSALAESVKGGRNYEGVTVTLSDDIDLAGSDLSIGGGEFKGTIDGNNKTISGLDLSKPGLLSGATVQNAKLEFTTETMNVSVQTPASALSEIATNYKNTTVTVEKDNASYTVTYGAAGTVTAAAFNGNSFEQGQTLATGIVYSFDGVTFASLATTEETAATATIANSTFGTASAAAIMLAAEGPAVLNATFTDGSVLTGNTFNGDVTIGGTATLKGNTMSETNTLTLGGSVTLIGNTLATVAMDEGAKVLFADGNTIGENHDPVSYQEGWTNSAYTFVGWNVVLNAEGEITSGTFVVGESWQNALKGLLADGADVLYYYPQTGLTTNAQGAYVVDSVDSLKKLQQYIGQQPDEIVELHIVLEADIDLSDIDSISASWTESKKIKGTIDGNGYAVYGLSEDAKLKTYTNSSIFGNMTADSEIKNISFIYDIFAAENYLTSDAQLIKTELLNGAILHDVLVCVRGTDKKSYWATSYWDNNGSATNSVPGKNTERVEKFLEK